MSTTPDAESATDLELQFQRDCEKFLEKLVAEGYSRWSLRQYRQTIKLFLSQVECQRRFPLCNASLSQVREAVLAKAPPSGTSHAKFRYHRIVEFLINAGWVECTPERTSQKSPRDQLREEYETHLRVERGLSKRTIFHCVRFYERFLTFRFGEGLGNLNEITPADIVAFLLTLQTGSRAYRDKTPPTHLRSLFKFFFRMGKTVRNLATSVPCMRQPQRTTLPRSLSRDEVNRLLDAVRTDDPAGCRNYAMLLLMARLGLRAMEVVAIRLEDLSWRSGEILIRGKGKLHARLPLPIEVGDSLVDYIRHGRKGNSRHLFVRNRAPYGAFRDGQIVNVILRNAFTATGLKPPQKYVGSHVLRHSLATGMLRNGVPLAEIGDILRHRSLTTTALYATYDIDGLRSIAQEWPIQEVGQ